MKNNALYILFTAILMVGTGYWAMFYTEKHLGITQITNETKNSLQVASDAQAKLVTQTVSKEFITTVINEVVNREVRETVVPAQIASAKSNGALEAMAPLLQSPALQETLKTLAESPAAVSAMTELATTVKEAEESGDNGQTLELVSRLDKADETIKGVEESIKTLQDLDVPALIVKLEELSKNTPSLTALDEAIKKTTEELTARGDKLIADEIIKLSEKFQRDINNESQPLQVQISSQNSSILNIQSSLSGLNTSIAGLNAKDLDILSQIGVINNDVGVLTLNMSTIAKQVVPVGGVLCVADWLGATIESNFVRADGQTISNPDSFFDGMAMPNLNVAQLYLRGGTTGGILQEASIPLLGNVLSDVTFGTVSLSDGAFGNNHQVYKNDSNVKIPIQLGDATELRPRSLTCVFYIRIQ